VAAKARRIDIPEDIRALGVLVDPDYTYACQLTASDVDRQSAEQWARDVFEGAPRLLGWFVLVGWIAILRLRLGPRRSSEYVLGWTVVSSTPGQVVLGAESFALSNRLVVQVTADRVVHATFVRYQRPIGAILWALARPIHQVVVPYLLRHAHRSFERSGEPL
jgi:Protein of unknown function (DUF2867)